MYLKGYKINKEMGTVRCHNAPESVKVVSLTGEGGEDLIDIRRWVYGVPGEGITLQRDMAEDLCLLLQYMFQVELVKEGL